MASKCNVSCIFLIKNLLICFCKLAGIALLEDGFKAVPADAELIPEGFRAIPAGHLDFDPAISALIPDGCRAIPAGHFNFDPDMVDVLGGKEARDAVTKAIIYEKINGWLLHYEQRGRDYVYNNIDQWAKQIRFWHAGTIRKHIKSLVEDGHLDRIRPSASAPSRYKKPITKDSDSPNQMSLWDEEKIPTVATKESDSSIHNPAFHKPSTTKQPTPAPARARKSKTLNGVAVATLPGMGEDDQDLPEPKPQVAEARPGNEAFDRAHDANAPIPSSAPPLPNEWETFFDGCSPDEVEQMVKTYGEPTLKNARIYAEADSSIANKPGYVRAQLLKGWRPPKPQSMKDWYAGGEFAAYIRT